MAKKRIMFIPWKESDNTLWADVHHWAKVGNRLQNPTQWTIVSPGKVDNKPLANLPQESQIYVRGHCKEGCDYIQPETGVKANAVTYQELGEMMFAAGLDKSYSGCIKIYACMSGLAGSDGPGFAHRLAQYLQDAKYLHCTVYGYTVSVLSYGALTETGTFHKRTPQGRASEYQAHCGGPFRFGGKPVEAWQGEEFDEGAL